MCRLRFPPSSSSIHESDPAAFVFVGVMMMMMMTTTTTTESFCLVYYFSCSFHTHTHTHTHTLKEEKKIISRAHQSFFTLWNLRQHSASSVATAAANSSRNMLFFFVWRGGRLYGCCTGCMSMVHTSLLSVHTLKKLLTGLKKESKK
jgi:hypothetical protein